MCLHHLTPTIDTQKGYKILAIADHKIYSYLYPYGDFDSVYGLRYYKPNKWYTNDKHRSLDCEGSGALYQSGFHCYYSKDDAIYYVKAFGGSTPLKVYEVSVKNVTCSGVQSDLSVFVAQSIKIGRRIHFD